MTQLKTAASALPQDPNSAYRALVAAGHIALDEAQLTVLTRLQALHETLHATFHKKSRLFRKRPDAAPFNIYIWGDVGRGKSMLMDLFFNHAPVERKKRVHFHRFMQDVHTQIHTIRATGKGDPVSVLVERIAAECSLLCFDELQATDVADATLLYRLFDGLFARGVLVVATSNRPPQDIYQGGVQRERFQKFVMLLNERMDIQALTSHSDYRLQKMRALTELYHAPLGVDAERFMERMLSHIAAGLLASKTTLQVHGRALEFTSYGEKVAVASFAELCDVHLGAADYLAIAEHFDTLMLRDIPKFTAEMRNQAKRFVTLIDALYEHKVVLICTAAVAPEALYTDGDGAFEFARTVSRLNEMQSADYLAKAEHVSTT